MGVESAGKGLINQAAVRPEAPPEPDPEQKQTEQKQHRPRLGSKK